MNKGKRIGNKVMRIGNIKVYQKVIDNVYWKVRDKVREGVWETKSSGIEINKLDNNMKKGH